EETTVCSVGRDGL
ncbi:putative protein phosphatase 2C, partial [Toxoplasma gondii RUB]